jgi:hypothetical protein
VSCGHAMSFAHRLAGRAGPTHARLRLEAAETPARLRRGGGGGRDAVEGASGPHDG